MHKRSPLEKRMRLRGGIWSFWGYDYADVRYTASTHQTDYVAALEAARKIERDRSVPPTDPAKAQAQAYTLAEALGLVAAHDRRVKAPANTVRFHVDRGRHLVRVFGAKCLLVGIKAKLKAYVDKRLDEDAADSTIAKELRVLRRAARLAHDDGFYPEEPSKLTVEGFTEDDVYEPCDVWLERVEWIDALIAHTSTNPDQHRIDRKDDLLVIINMGLRRRELLKLHPEHVDLQRGIVSVRRAKRGRKRKREPRGGGLKTKKSQRELPLNDVMRALFARRLRFAKAGHPLFVDWGSGNRDLQANWRRARAWLLDQEKTPAARAELDAVLPHGLTFNDLRRTFCSLMKNAGVSLEDCAELLGHEDTAMVKLVYGQTAMETLRKAVAKLPSMQLPPEQLRPRTKGPSRRQRQRLARKGTDTKNVTQSLVESKVTDTVFDTNSGAKSGRGGAR